MPNAFGLYDMYGNVWEWVQDRWHSNYAGAPNDGSAWEDGESTYRVIRGGACYDSASYCRSGYRLSYSPGLRVSFIGVRLVRTP